MDKLTPEQEAERLYPNDPHNDDWYTDSQVSSMQRSAHITAARQYMDTIDKQRAENEKLRKALEYCHKAKMRLDIPNVTDDELTANWNYFLTQNGFT